MTNVTSAIRDTVSISLFNRGMAGKIFDDVKKTGAKVVMKNNTAECVLLSPREYSELMDEVNDARLLALADKRMASYSHDNLVSWEEMNSRLGITEEDIGSGDEAEIE